MSGYPSRPSRIYRCFWRPDFQRQIVCRDLSAVAGQVEVKQVATRQERPGGWHEQVTEEEEFCSNKMERVFKANVWICNYCST
jgi:hypothetical protein